MLVPVLEIFVSFVSSAGTPQNTFEEQDCLDMFEEQDCPIKRRNLGQSKQPSTATTKTKKKNCHNILHKKDQSCENERKEVIPKKQ